MELIGYTSIAASPFFLFLIVYFVAIIYACFKSVEKSFDKLTTFMALNVFPDILKSKKDNNNQTVVYFRKEKVQLREEKTLKRVEKTLFWISLCLITLVSFGFGQFAFIEYSYDCQGMEGKDCFEYPIDTGFHAVRANCSDPDILNGKKLVLCYKLVFNFELAVGVCYGMYKVCTVILSISSTLIIKINKNHIIRLKIAVGIFVMFITLIASLVLLSTVKSHSVMRSYTSYLKLVFNSILVYATLYLFIYYMPWEEIIEQKERANRTEGEIENSATAESNSSQASDNGRGSRDQEAGLNNPIDPTNL